MFEPFESRILSRNFQMVICRQTVEIIADVGRLGVSIGAGIVKIKLADHPIAE